MEQFTLKNIVIPLIKAIDTFNFLLKSHHRRVAIMSYYIGKQYGLSNKDLANLVVAASIHDIGALSVEERDQLIREDVEDPSPHCLLAFRILSNSEAFSEIAKILKHHHIRYDQIHLYEAELSFLSHIIHFADRIDIYTGPDKDIFLQKEEITEKLRQRTGSIFHPEVYNAFLEVSNNDEFWSSINEMSMEQILSLIDFSWDKEIYNEDLVEFASIVSKIVDYRSHFTATHSFTVGHLAHYIGGLMNCDDEYRMKLLIAGYLHDIGKIAIDPGIIEKKEKLNEQEYQEIKKHPYFTGKILEELSNYDWFKDVVKWAQHHHEKNDGSGYPDGLRGEEIDLGTKIISYADILSALMEDRPYRKALSASEAKDVIKKDFSTRIDKKIFKVIKKHFLEIQYFVKNSQREAKQVYLEPLSDLISRVSTV